MIQASIRLFYNANDTYSFTLFVGETSEVKKTQEDLELEALLGLGSGKSVSSDTPTYIQTLHNNYYRDYEAVELLKSVGKLFRKLGVEMVDVYFNNNQDYTVYDYPTEQAEKKEFFRYIVTKAKKESRGF